MENLKSAIGRFVAERQWEQFHSPKNLAMALCVEVSEVAEHFQWLTQEQSRNLPPEKVREVAQEIGDVMIYLVELSEQLGVDPIQAATEKVATNTSKYPADVVRGKAAKYTEYLQQ